MGAFSRLGVVSLVEADLRFGAAPFPLPEITSMISAFFKPETLISSDLAISLSSVTAFFSRTERSIADTYASCIDGNSSPRLGFAFSQSSVKVRNPASVRGCFTSIWKTLKGIVAISAPILAASTT